MKPRILLVDDEELNLLTFEAFLAEDGYDLHMATNGRAAITLARTLSPDLIVLDVMMPEVDGFAVCRAIRSDPEIGHVPIMIVTALHDSTSRLEGLRAGADDYVTKPCSRDELRARVRTIASLNRFRRIAEQRAKFERLYDAAPVGIVLTDRRGVVTAANPLARRLLAEPGERPLANDLIFARFPAAEAAVLRKAVDDGLAGAAVEPRELRRSNGGEQRILRLHVTVIPDADGQRAMLIFSDVTGEVQARQALEKINVDLDELVQARTRQLQEANGLLLSYASFVSHDLRSPLALMKGYLSMIHDGVVPLAQAGALVENAYQATLMMQELVHNILQLAHDEHEGASSGGDFATEPAPVVERVWQHIAVIFPHPKRQFTLGVLPPVNANALLLERVFYNLLANAAKFSLERPEPRIEIGAVDSPSGPALFVRDNGIGFDARDADRLFQEFSRLPAQSTTDGFGLGLSLVSRLVRAHGGRMWAEGKEGEGATFFVQFKGVNDGSDAAGANATR